MFAKPTSGSQEIEVEGLEEGQSGVAASTSLGDSVTKPGDDNDVKLRGKLFSRGFISLMGVSFFGAANDNILKQILTMMVVVGGLWANRLGAGTQGIVFLVLSMPFIFLSGYSGQLADKFSKRDVILWVKIAEVPIALVALAGLLVGSFWISLLALLLLAIQSSFYGPAKFGIIPDLVPKERLSQANGLLVGLSNVAVILGSLAAGPLADMYYPTIPADQVAVVDQESNAASKTAQPVGAMVVNLNEEDEVVPLVPDPSREPMRLPAGLALLSVAIAGAFTVLMLPKMKAVAPGLKLSGDFFRPHIETFKQAERPLVVVLFCWSGFYLIASLALLILPDFRSILGVSNTAITNLIGLLAISIVVGSLSVGFLSGKTIRPYFSLVGAFGLSICFLIMGLVTLSYFGLAVVVFMIGFFAGFYIVPLQALLQYLSPEEGRGRFFGTANALSFVFISAAALIYYLLARGGIPPTGIAMVCAVLALSGTIVGMLELNKIMAAQNRTFVTFEGKEEGESTH